MAASSRNDWDEKTALNEQPGATFAATEAAAESGERVRSLDDLYDTGDNLEVTRVVEVPSAVLRAAADPDKTLEIRADGFPDLPVSSREPAIEVPMRVRTPRPSTARLDVAVVVGMVLAMLVLAATMAIVAANGG